MGLFKHKKEIIVSLIIFILVFLQPMIVHADMGPKPCIYVTFENLGDRTVYASFFALKGGPSPVSYGDWDSVPEEIRQKFLDYSETEDSRFVEDIWIINEENPTMECGYMPPDKYKLVVYVPDEDIMPESDFYSRENFEEKYTVNIPRTNDKLILEHVAYNQSINFLMIILRVILTIIIELAIAFLFKIKGKKSISVIIITNVATQLFLNIKLSSAITQSGSGLYAILLYFMIEIVIFFAEAFVYSIALKRVNNPPIRTLKAIAYAFVANLTTFIIGLFLAF